VTNHEPVLQVMSVGQTIVALQSAIVAIENGCQAAIIASDNAEQPPGTLTLGSTVSSGTPDRFTDCGKRELQRATLVAIGTTRSYRAVQFQAQLVVIDEQHRFGVLRAPD
jgi:RecG-like helicase